MPIEDYNQAMIDLHIHTLYSFDSDEAAENYLEKAVANGDKTVGFVDHYDLDLIVEDLPHKQELFDIEARSSRLAQLQKSFPSVEILSGIEFGYSPKAIEVYRQLLKKHNFDYSMLSVHTLPEKGDFYYQSVYEKMSSKHIYMLYLQRVYESVCADLDFEIVAHLGYLMRYVPYLNKTLVFDESYELLDRILKKIIERNLFLEINMSGKGEWGCPEKLILDRYIQLGGKNFTLGSDAHVLANYKRNFNAAKDYLLSKGIDGTYHFKAHKPIKDSF